MLPLLAYMSCNNHISATNRATNQHTHCYCHMPHAICNERPQSTAAAATKNNRHVCADFQGLQLITQNKRSARETVVLMTLVDILEKFRQNLQVKGIFANAQLFLQQHTLFLAFGAALAYFTRVSAMFLNKK